MGNLEKMLKKGDMNKDQIECWWAGFCLGRGLNAKAHNEGCKLIKSHFKK